MFERGTLLAPDADRFTEGTYEGVSAQGQRACRRFQADGRRLRRARPQETRCDGRGASVLPEPSEREDWMLQQSVAADFQKGWKRGEQASEALRQERKREMTRAAERATVRRDATRPGRQREVPRLLNPDVVPLTLSQRTNATSKDNMNRRQVGREG